VRTLILATACVASACVGAGSAHAFQTFPASCTRSDFHSGTSLVRAELCTGPATVGRAVVVLHGCGGFSTFDHRLAVGFPQQGIETLDVDYFGPTPPPGKQGFCNAFGHGRSAFPVWERVAVDAAHHLRSLPGVRPKRVGIVGWSLGGGVALAGAVDSAGAHPFDAVAAFSTPGAVAPYAKLLPPTILLSGGRTDAEPLSVTLPLYRALRAAHVPTELYVYPRGSHNWPGRQGTLGIAHAAAFLRRELR
jgi:dienelactone hydrolase